MNEFIKDLKVFIYTNHKSQSEYARSINISGAMVCGVLKGVKKPTQRMLDDVGYEIKTIYLKK